MIVSEFVNKWRRVELTERSASHQHFLDLCEVFEHPKPAEVDPSGEWFTFERGADKHGGGKGWADVWKRGYFGWEYKGKHKNLDAAYSQLLKYREALENPPLLVVCDMDRIVIHTNFTATAHKVYDIPLAQLDTPYHIDIIRQLFHEPERLRPGVTSAAITTEVARRLADVAQGLRQRGLDSADVARFLDRIVFCLFAEDVGLLPERLFSRIVEKSSRDPQRFARLIGQLFDAMAAGGDFGLETIRHFNGNLFAQSPILELTTDEIESIQAAAKLDWSAVDPSIFGTLFERGLDPAKRSQLGAQYTSREDIETLIEPVVMQPLRQEWHALRQTLDAALESANQEFAVEVKKRVTPEARNNLFNRLYGKPRSAIREYLERLAELKILDPACGSGNFLYVTLQKLKDLEKEVLVYASDAGLGTFLPLVGPWQFYGIEVNPYAYDLAQTTLWIGYLQWIRANGFNVESDPILRPMDNFKCMDAILDLSDADNPQEPGWPAVDFIIGNPPFLGGSKVWEELGRDYQQKLWRVYKDRVPGFADLCCYWFEKARQQIVEGHCRRAGLLATQAIRGGANRAVLKRIKETGDIFFAISDRPWILNGASVHTSMVGFDDGREAHKSLDGEVVDTINADLSKAADITQACSLKQNMYLSYTGTKKSGDFNISKQQAIAWLHEPNPHGKPNSNLLKPWLNGEAIVKRPAPSWIIDTGTSLSHEEFTLYEKLYLHALTLVKPERDKNKRPIRRDRWWLHAETAPAMRQAVAGLSRYLATPRIAKYRIFIWVSTIVLPDDGVYIFARSDDFFFGLLHSRLHEVWALKLGTQLETRPRYTATTCFETFPFPQPTPAQEAAIAEAAKELDDLRTRWLNPPEWTREETLEFPGAIDGPWARYVHDPDARGIGTVRYPRIVPKDAAAATQLAKRTLTNLYNQRPTWLDLAHKKLDAAVMAAYGWSPAISDEDILANLLALNLEREPAKG